MNFKVKIFGFVSLVFAAWLLILYQARQILAVVHFEPLEPRLNRDSRQILEATDIYSNKAPTDFDCEMDANKQFEALPVDYSIKSVSVGDKSFLCIHFRSPLLSVKWDNVAVYRRVESKNGGDAWTLLQMYYKLDGVNGFNLEFSEDGGIGYQEVSRHLPFNL